MSGAAAAGPSRAARPARPARPDRPARPVRAEVIRTERLELLPLRVDHAGEMASVLSDPALHTFTGGTPSTVDELRSRYARMVAGPSDPGVSWCNWVLVLGEGGSRRLTGTVQVTIGPGRRGLLAAEIAWVVGTPWQGRGIATEAARGLVRWLDARGVGVLIAHIHPDHAASAAVAGAVGLAPTDARQDGETRWERSSR